MGWQDAPEVSQPAWAQAPEVAPAPVEPTGTPAEQSAAGKPFYADLLNGQQWKQAAKNVGNLGAQAITGTGATIAGGLAGLTTLGTNAVGLTNTSPADVVRGIQQKYTYQPSADQSAQKLNSVVGYPGKKLGEFQTWLGEGVTDYTGSPLLGSIAAAAPQAALFAASAPQPKTPMADSVAAVDKYNQQLASSKSIVSEARSAGYSLKPSDAGGTAGKVAEGASGSAKLENALARKNAAVTDSLAAKAVGLPEGAPVTSAALDEVAAPNNAMYQKVGEVLGDVPTDGTFNSELMKLGKRQGGSFPNAKNAGIEDLKQAYNVPSFSAADAVEEVKQLRFDGSKNLRSMEPASNALGRAQLNVAKALENQMDRYGASIGQEDLISQFQQARVNLAKINTVRDALIGDTGHVSASDVLKSLSRKFGDRLPEGELGTIARVAKSFGGSVKDINKLKNSVPINAFDYTVGGLGALAAHNPLVGSLALARPVTRGVLASDMYQASLGTAAPALGVPTATTNALAFPPSAFLQSLQNPETTNALRQQMRSR